MEQTLGYIVEWNLPSATDAEALTELLRRQAKAVNVASPMPAVVQVRFGVTQIGTAMFGKGEPEQIKDVLRRACAFFEDTKDYFSPKTPELLAYRCIGGDFGQTVVGVYINHRPFYLKGHAPIEEPARG